MSTDESSRAEIISRLNFEIFKSLSQDVIDAYDKGYASLFLVGPRISAQIMDTIEKMLRKKYEVDDKTFESMIMGLLFCLHYVLTNEDRDILGKLKKSKRKDIARKMEEKLNFIKEIIAKNPQIEQSFFTHSSSISNILDRLDWEASLKIRKSEKTEKILPPVASGKILIVVGTSAHASTAEYETKSIEFDVSLKDVDHIIRSLTELRGTLANLQTKKLA